jgi:glycosyltransferase involved in cell wall biosynthesis
MGVRLVLFAGDPGNPVKRFWLAREAVAMAASRLSAPVRIVMLRGVPHKMVPLYMNACDVLLLTSLHEGSPNVVKEALACNLPIVSVDVGDVRDRVRDVDGCVVCEHPSPVVIGNALVSVLSNPRRIRGRNAILHLERRVVAQNIVRVYLTIANSGLGCVQRGELLDR